jgi:hypothetical protein
MASLGPAKPARDKASSTRARSLEGVRKLPLLSGRRPLLLQRDCFLQVS